MKKIISFFLALMSAIFCISCGKGTSPSSEKQYGEEVPEYTSNENIMFGMWIGVPGTMPVYDENKNYVSAGSPLPDDKFRQYYQEIKEAGFTVADVGYYGVNYQTNLRALAMAEEVGVKQLVYDAGLLSVLGSKDLSDEQIIRQIKVNYAAYLSSPAFAGIRVKDEPTFDEIPNYERMCNLWNKIAPGTIFYVNLFPVIASKAVTAEDYKDYVKQFTKYIDTDYVSYDHYVLKYGNSGNYILRNFLYNLTEVKIAAPDREAWTIVQSIEHGASRKLTSAADCGFQAYTALACGYTGISWFCYWTPTPFDGATHFGDGAYDIWGNKTPIYDYIKDTQLEIKAFEQVYLNFDWQGIICNIGTENDNGGENDDFALSKNAYVTSDRIKSVVTQQDTIIGVFKDNENRDGFMVVNFTEPSAGLKNKVKLTFNDCQRAIVITDGVQEVVDVNNGILEFTQNSGDGTFIIPLK